MSLSYDAWEAEIGVPGRDGASSSLSLLSKKGVGAGDGEEDGASGVGRLGRRDGAGDNEGYGEIENKDVRS